MERERRRFLTWLGRSSGGLLAAAAVLLGERVVRPARLLDLSRKTRLGPVVDFPPGCAVHLRKVDVHLMHRPEGLCAISGRCTHLGCSVRLEPDGFACPCHGARFDLLGRPVAGPAPRPLGWFGLRVDARGDLWLDLDERLQPGTWKRI